MKKILKDKRIIITAGPVWVHIDQVRVITNIFGGLLGYIISCKASEMGAKVTLLMGPGRVLFSGREKFNIIRFKEYDEIYSILKKHIKQNQYDVIIHSAAIPDYIPNKKYEGKIKSGAKELIIKFKPTKKIVDEIKKWDPNIMLVKFKLEVDVKKKRLIDLAYNSMIYSDADIMVANELSGIENNHLAYIITPDKKIIKVCGKHKIASVLLNKISRVLK